MAALKGLYATTDKGTPCLIINQNATHYKVTLGIGHVYAGDHAERRLVSYSGKTGWMPKDKIRR